MSPSRMLAVVIVMAMLSVGFVPVCGGVAGLDMEAPSDHAPILIDGNADFAAQASSEGWSGDGTADDPFTITGLSIISDANIRAIEISNTTAHFVISHCVIVPIEGQVVDWSSYSTGVWLKNVTNGRLSELTISSFVHGIWMESCSAIRLDNSTITGPKSDCLRTYYSSNLVIENNTMSRSEHSGLSLRSSDHNIIQGNNISFNINSGLDLDFGNNNNLIRWNLASRNGYYGGGLAIYIAGTGNLIYGNVLVAPGGSNSMPAGVGYGSVNNWNSSSGVGNYYGANYDSWKGVYTSFLGKPMCSSTDNNGDGRSDETYAIKNYASTDPRGPEHDYHPLIYPLAPPRDLEATVSGDQVTLTWQVPSYITDPFGHYVLVRNDGVARTEIDVSGMSYQDTISDTDAWTSINYTVKWVGRYASSAESNVAIGQNPDRPTVKITSELGSIRTVIGSTVVYSNHSLDPRSVIVGWTGFDSDSTSMTYQVRLDDGPWLDNGHTTQCTLAGLGEGNHTVTVRATDNGGNHAEDSKTFSTYRYVRISVTCEPYQQDGESRLRINGTAWDAITGASMEGLDIGIAYSIQQGSSWATTSAVSGADGSFEITIALEKKAIMGLFFTTTLTDMNSEDHYFFENATYAAIDLQGREGTFLTMSTSTLSDFTYSSNMMKFSTHGGSTAAGATSLLIPKTALGSTNGISITVDGSPVDFEVESGDDYWTLTFNHTSGNHQVEVSLPSSSLLGGSSEALIVIVLVVVVLVAGVSIFFYWRRKLG